MSEFPAWRYRTTKDAIEARLFESAKDIPAKQGWAPIPGPLYNHEQAACIDPVLKLYAMPVTGDEA